VAVAVAIAVFAQEIMIFTVYTVHTVDITNVHGVVQDAGQMDQVIRVVIWALPIQAPMQAPIRVPMQAVTSNTYLRNKRDNKDVLGGLSVVGWSSMVFGGETVDKDGCT